VKLGTNTVNQELGTIFLKAGGPTLDELNEIYGCIHTIIK